MPVFDTALVWLRRDLRLDGHAALKQKLEALGSSLIVRYGRAGAARVQGSSDF